MVARGNLGQLLGVPLYFGLASVLSLVVTCVCACLCCVVLYFNMYTLTYVYLQGFARRPTILVGERERCLAFQPSATAALHYL